MSTRVRYMVDKNRLDDPHVKANLLFQVDCIWDSYLVQLNTFSDYQRSFLFFFWCAPWFQAHFSQLELPISDYVTDLKSVLDQSIRIIQAMIDICSNSGWLLSAINCMNLLQMVMQVSISVLYVKYFRRANQVFPVAFIHVKLWFLVLWILI